MTLYQMQSQFDDEGVSARIRRLRRQARAIGEPGLMVGTAVLLSAFALLACLAALLP